MIANQTTSLVERSKYIEYVNIRAFNANIQTANRISKNSESPDRKITVAGAIEKTSPMEL
jgi:hypothetical protein